MMKLKPITSQSGATMLEYAVAVAILLPIFLIAGIMIKEAISIRGDSSRNTTSHTTPKNEALSILRSQGDSAYDNTFQDEH